MEQSDPILGTWKLNTDKTEFSPFLLAILNQKSVKGATAVYREIDSNLLEYIGTYTPLDGAPISGTYTWPRQGGIAKKQAPAPLPDGMSIVETLIAPGNWCATFLQNGIQVMVVHKIVRENGKTMQEIYRGMDPQGKSFEAQMWYDRG
jgi:hypothetical protein